DFDDSLHNPVEEIRKRISLKNCEIENLAKTFTNHFFTRFTFRTQFRYLNESETVMGEIYVHDGEVVSGDLSGYRVVEGTLDSSSSSDSSQSSHSLNVSPDTLRPDHEIAIARVKELVISKTHEISEVLEKNLGEEESRIRIHYENLLGELGGDLQSRISKIKELELALRVADGVEADELRVKHERLQKNLVKIGDDDSRSRILKEQSFTLQDAKTKHSLTIDNKLMNTTIIYYPVYSCNLYLKGYDSKRFITLSYDPLLQKLGAINCEVCKNSVVDINLCSNGHITCEDCLDKCGECGKIHCKTCVSKSCSGCAKKLCKSCSFLCFGCSNYVCINHLRNDVVTGEQRCAMCLRACLRCHGLTEAKYFGEAIDGSKVCQKCLGGERRGEVLKDVFRE
ncbi:hypothetical protein HN604_04095, partial [archaeon]|nr:hypothetical protein [archaeon]